MKSDEQGLLGQQQESQAGRPSTLEGREVADVAKKKTTTSPKKIAANRRNALKSTGPRTLNGKKRVSTNATRHGFFSKWLLIQRQDGKESQQEYDNFCAGVQKHYDPVGWLEELWGGKDRRVVLAASPPHTL
jgi:hypothetical protein